MKTEPLLRGRRVTLRLAKPGDVTAIVRFHIENREFFKPTDPPKPPEFYTEAYWTERVATTSADYHQDRSCHLFLFPKREEAHVLGLANFSNFVRGAFQACHLGYALAEKEQGKGLMTEALQLAIEFAFEELRMHRIMANYLPRNERSGSVLRKLGFAVEGYARDYLFIDGRWQDHILTSRTNDRWRPAR